MDDRGASMTDTSPLVRIKKAFVSLKGELKNLELRIGVVGHSLMQAKLRHKSVGGKDGSSGGNTRGGRGGDEAEFEIDDDDDDSDNSLYL